jgi:cytoskeleton protein RodZ
MSKTTEAQADSVGALLRQSREQKGLTTTQVATQLRLKVSQIEQIEAEEWDPAVSATFMRGYLRAYARLLKLPEQEILQNFELQAAYLRNQAKPMHSFSKKNRLDAVDNRFMLATYLLVVLLIGLFLIWFWQTHILDSQPVSVLPEYRVSEDASTGLNTTARPDVASKQPANLASNTSPADITTRVADTPVAVTTEHSLTAVPPNAGSQTANPAMTAPAVTSQPQATEAVPATETPSTTQAANTLPAAEAEITQPQLTTDAPAAVSTEQPLAGTAQLQLTFSAECWVTVQDATGKRLAYGMRSAGQSLQLTGQLPFSVTLGNATAATVQLNQTAVDLSGYKAGQVARLTLDGQP